LARTARIRMYGAGPGSIMVGRIMVYRIMVSGLGSAMRSGGIIA
jgi:hypothetical protein